MTPMTSRQRSDDDVCEAKVVDVFVVASAALSTWNNDDDINENDDDDFVSTSSMTR